MQTTSLEANSYLSHSSLISAVRQISTFSLVCNISDIPPLNLVCYHPTYVAVLGSVVLGR